MPSLSGQPVLVTGASGFIGGHLVERLIARGCRVSCLARGTSDVDDLRLAGATIVQGDVTDRAAITRALASANARYVFHLAGLVRALSAVEFNRLNAGGVEAVAEACVERTEPPVLVLVSSLAAAGPAGTRPALEGDTPAPISNYGRSKLAGEQVAMRHAARMPITVVRPGVVFGAGDRGMLQVFRPIARRGLHAVGGDGTSRLSLVAVTDLVECLILAAERGERLAPNVAGHGIYYVAAEDLSTVELGHAIAHALGQPPPRVLHLPARLMQVIGMAGDVGSRIRGRAGWVGRDKVGEILAGSWTCSSAKARQQLGWQPAVPLAERLRETAQWYRGARWL
jgi:nucleoside-diphosphate-sugar epimerase